MAEEFLTDDEQVQEVKRLVREYAPVLILGALLGGGGLFGWRYYQSHQTENALKASDQFNAMSLALQTSDTKKARDLANGIIQNYGSLPYADQARLALARMDVDEGHDANAVAPLTEVMNNSKDSELKHIARLRLARVLIDQGKPDDAIQLLAAATPGSFTGRYHQVHGDALYAKKDAAGAIAEYKAALEHAADGGVDSALVEMKLADLGATEQPSANIKVKP
jgi:predicted negative regulator of RcsB-dependent stress response